MCTHSHPARTPSSLNASQNLITTLTSYVRVINCPTLTYALFIFMYLFINCIVDNPDPQCVLRSPGQLRTRTCVRNNVYNNSCEFYAHFEHTENKSVLASCCCYLATYVLIKTSLKRTVYTKTATTAIVRGSRAAAAVYICLLSASAFTI